MNDKAREHWLCLALVVALMLFAATPALALVSSLAAASAPQQVERTRAVGAAGFTAAHVGGVALRGTLGQPFVGVSRSGSVTLSHGFWHGVREAGHTVYLPLVLR